MDKEVLDKVGFVLRAKENSAGKEIEDPTHNFVIPTELTVTITLAEYRMLIKKGYEVEKEEDSYRGRYWKLQEQYATLKKEFEKLKEKLAPEEEEEGEE